jgi:CHAD domain-containing protein
LHECQRTEQQKLVEALESQRYRKLLRDWSHFLDRPDSGDAGRPADAGTAVIRVAADRIRRAFQRVRKRSRGLDTNTSAKLLHRLRIDCKKLRYLLEFFRSLYEKQGLAQLVRALKRLQDDLGDFNDLEIQQRQLQSMASHLLEAGKAPAETLLAMGCLVGRLAERQEKLKRRLLRRVDAFVKQRNRSLLDELIR